MKEARLDKYLTLCGLGSRSQVREMVANGRVKVNGHVVKDSGFKVCPGVDDVCASGYEELCFKEHLYIMLHKPEGVLSATRDQQATVLDLLPPSYRRHDLAPVGRLDKDTTGLLIITDDGQTAHGLLAPRRHVEKRYRATLDKPVTQDDAEAFQRGIALADITYLPAKLEVGEATAEGFTAYAYVVEGKFHQVKRMFQSCGKTVLQLHRERFGPLTLDEDLKPGECRLLTQEEEKTLREAAKTAEKS